MIARRHVLKLVVGVAICIAAILVHRSLGRYTIGEIEESIRSIPGFRLVAAAFFVMLSYIMLTGFDALAVRYAGRSLAYRRVALASFTALSIGHNVGFAALSSGAVRYRFYSRWGLTGEEIAKVIVFCGATSGLGLAMVAGLSLLLTAGDGPDFLGLDPTMQILVGLAFLAVPAAYLLLCAFVRRTVRIRTWRFEPPQLALGIGQIIVATLNFSCVAAVIQQLLLGFAEVHFVEVARAYVTANIASIVSHVPGGLGVMEATIHGILPSAASIGALIAFRVIYFFVPLTIGVPVLLISEAYYRHRGGRFSEQTIM